MKKKLRRHEKTKEAARVGGQNSRFDRASKRKLAFAKRKRNFLPALVAAILAWSFWVWFVLNVSPSGSFPIFVFFVSLFVAVFLTSSLVLANSRRGLWFSLGTIFVLVFRYHDFANLLNIFILAGLFISLELYFSKKV